MRSLSIIGTEETYISNKKIGVPKEALLKIKKVCAGMFIQHTLNDILKEDKDIYEIKTGDFVEIFKDLIFNADLGYDYTIVDKIEAPLEIKKAYIDAAQRYYADREGKIPDKEDINFICNGDRENCAFELVRKLVDGKNDIDDVLTHIFDLLDANERLNKLRDLIDAKESIIDNLKYICEKNIVLDFENRYAVALNEYDIKKLEEILRDAQSIILKHWESFTTDIKDYRPGNPFSFVCHSTRSSKFEGKFYTRYVSCSLISNQLMDTYNFGYGFILNPKNIVGASSKDMYVFNNAEDIDSMITYSSIPKIDSPEKIMVDTLAQKKENEQKGEEKKVYSEVVVDGFEPTAIFCLTDGSKELNSNYRSAYDIKKSFPHLEVVEIDITLYKKSTLEMIETLIKEIEHKLTGHYKFFDEEYLNRFSNFWNQYLKLKNTGNYTEDDIINLYLYNKKLVWYDADINEILSGKYDIETIKFALLNGVKFDVSNVLKKPIELSSLIILYRNLKDVNDINLLNEIIPGLGTFIELYPKIVIHDNIIEELNNLPTITFTSINELFVNQIELKRKRLTDELEEYYNQEKSLELEINKKQSILEQIDKCEQFIMYEFMYDMAKKDVEGLTGELKKQEDKQKEYQESSAATKEEIKKKEEEKKKLEKNKFLNYLKIEKLTKEIDELLEKVWSIDFKLESINKDREFTMSSLKQNYDRFKERLGCLLDEYPSVLDGAKKFLETHDRFKESMDITNLKIELSNLKMKIERLQDQLGAAPELDGGIKI